MRKIPKEEERHQDWLSDIAGPGELDAYEQQHLPTPGPGPFETPEGLAEALALDYFSPDVLNTAQTKFRSEFTAADEPLLNTLETYIRAYADSAAKPTEELLELKLSIIAYCAALADAIRHKHDKLVALEPHKRKLRSRLDEIPVIPAAFLDKYAKATRKIVKETLTDYAAFLNSDNPDFHRGYADIPVCQGISNVRYYKKTNKSTDFLSLYAADAGTSLEYFHPRIVNSYSLSLDTAERFMVQGKNQRRGIVMASYE